MNPEKVSFSLPPGAVKKGVMFNTYEPAYLCEDMLEIDLPSGLTIDVGWCPEEDPKGSFRVVLYHEHWHNQAIPPILSQTIPDVVEIVEMLATRFSQPVPSYSTSCSSNTTVQMSRTSDDSFDTRAVAA